MGVVDTVMVGHLAAGDSSIGLASVALGHLYFFGIGVFGMGTLMVLDPVVAQAVGAGTSPAVARGIQRGVLLALMLAVPSVGPAARGRRRSSGWRSSRRRSSRSRRPTRSGSHRASPVLPVHRVPAEPAGAAADRRHPRVDRGRQPGQRRPQLGADLRSRRRAGDGRARLRLGHDGEPLAALPAAPGGLAWRDLRPHLRRRSARGLGPGAARTDAPARPPDRHSNTCSSSAPSPSSP